MKKLFLFVSALALSISVSTAHTLTIRLWNFTGKDFGQYGSAGPPPATNVFAMALEGSLPGGNGPWPNSAGTYVNLVGDLPAGTYVLYHACYYGSPLIRITSRAFSDTADETWDWFMFDDGCEGCSQTNGCVIDDYSDGLNKRDTDCSGMPKWEISQPAISVWLRDEPLGYQPGIGPRVALDLDFKQREYSTGLDTNIFSVGKKWNCSWLSYVTRDANQSNVVLFAGGGQRTFYGTNDYLTGTSLTGNTNTGFTATYPDGSQDVFGFIVTNNSGQFQKAFLTQRINPAGQGITFNYSSYSNSNPVIRLQSVVDADGYSTTISYNGSNPYSTNLISQVTDRYGRTCSLAYDSTGHLTSVTDVVGIASSVLYDSHDWATNLTTPYGTTSFEITDGSATNAPDGRAIRVTEPDGGHQLYLYKDFAPGIASSYSGADVPSTSPFTNSFESGDLQVRNTFHWGRRQYEYLNSTNVASLTTNDFRKARMLHWLKTTYGVTGQTLSLERAPSPDTSGATEGQKTWYDHAGKPNGAYEGSQPLPLFVARVLPNTTNQFVRTERNSLGMPLLQISTFSSNNAVALRTNSFSYYANGVDLQTATNAISVQVSSNSYNAYHQVVTNLDALNQATTFTYDANHRLASATLPTGLILTNTYFDTGSDSNRLKTTIEYELVGGSPVYYRTNSYTYTNGLVSTHTDPRGLVITSAWDSLQRLTNSSDSRGSVSFTYTNLDLIRVIDRMGFTNSFGYDPLRRLVAATNANGTVTRYGYCSCGSMQSQTNAFGTSIQQATQNTFDLQGNLIQTVGPDGYTLNYNFNSLGQLTNVTDGLTSTTNWFNNQGLLIASSNALGRLQAVIYDTLDRATNVVDVNGVTTTNTFDNLNRLAKRAYPDGGVEKFGYSSRGLTAYTNQLNLTNFIGYDALGRKTFTTNANWEIVQYQYSPASDLTNLIDGKLHSTKWGIDQFGRVTNKVDAAAAEVARFSYDANNRLLSRWTAEKGATYFTNDAVGNLTNIKYPVSSNLTFSYDALNRLTTMSDGVGSTIYGYNSANQLLSEDGPWSNDTVSYTYANRLRSGMSLAAPNSSAWTQTYGYDAAKRPTSVTSAAGAFSYAYDALRSTLPNKLLFPNGAFITNTFDSNARLLGTILKNSSGTNLNSHQYAYNLANQRTWLTNTAGDYRSYDYDNAGQLTGLLSNDPNGALRLNERPGYGYDAAGNLTRRVYASNNSDPLIQNFNINTLNQITSVTRSGSFTVWGTTTGPATNVSVNGLTALLYADNTFASTNQAIVDGNNTYTAIAKDSYGRSDTNTVTSYLPATNSFEYDLNGNLRTNGTRFFDYDDENQLIRITEPNAWKSEFTYDGKMRRRIRKEYSWSGGAWSQTNEVRYVYDRNLVVQERDGNNLPVVAYTRGRDLSGGRQSAGGIGGLLARSDNRLLLAADSSANGYYAADGSGNVTALINTNQIAVGRYLYDPFGNILSQSGPLADANLYRFSSKELHPPSGLTYHLRRFYDPSLQRWLNRDPSAEGGGVNLYRYARNSPIRNVDSWGRAVFPVDQMTPPPQPGNWDWKRNPAGPPDDTATSSPIVTVVNGDIEGDGGISFASQDGFGFGGGTDPGAFRLEPAQPAQEKPCLSLASKIAIAIILAQTGIGIVDGFLAGAAAATEIETAGAGLRLLEAGEPGLVVPNALLDKEIAFANEIVALRGGTLEGGMFRQAGIDGFLDGTPISLKQVTGHGLGAVLRNAGMAETQAANAGYSGVELFIQAQNVRSAELIDFAINGSLTRIPNQGTISFISIQTRDGWVLIPGH